MKVTITSQTHPLYGQHFDIYEISFSNNNLELIFELPSGELVTIPSNLTDYIVVPENASTSTLRLLDIEGLRQVVKLVDQIREEEFE